VISIKEDALALLQPTEIVRTAPSRLLGEGRSQRTSGTGEDLGVYSSNNVNGLQGLSLFSGPEGIELLSL